MIKLTLNKYLDSHGITRYELAQKTKTRFAIIDSYYKNKVVRYDSDILNRICAALGCDITDLISYTEDEKPL